jgi:hypothetical protein
VADWIGWLKGPCVTETTVRLNTWLAPVIFNDVVGAWPCITLANTHWNIGQSTVRIFHLPSAFFSTRWIANEPGKQESGTIKSSFAPSVHDALMQKVRTDRCEKKGPRSNKTWGIAQTISFMNVIVVFRMRWHRANQNRLRLCRLLKVLIEFNNSAATTFLWIEFDSVYCTYFLTLSYQCY